MKTILFERRAHTYLPEIEAYIAYLERHCPDVKAYDSIDLDDCRPEDFDVVWRFMGMDVKGGGRYVVQEYNSLSAGFLPRFRNFIKARINQKPDRRVFLNETVMNDFSFKDGVPFNLRDMGVAEAFFDTPRAPEYDFVYAGSVHRGGEVLKVLEHFSKTLHEASILIVGEVHEDIRAQYKGFNIHFAGRVAYKDVPALMAKGRMGLNLIPDHYPFNIQTATKVLEYCALGLSVVSMKYSWIERFMAERGGSFFFLDPDYGNLSMENISGFDFKTPTVEDLRWDDIIRESKVFEFIKEL